MRPRLKAGVEPPVPVAQLFARPHHQGDMPMFRMMPVLYKGSGAAGFVTGLALALAVTIAGPMTVRSEDRVPGLTGTDRPDEVVQARQLLMDGIETEMAVIEIALEGATPPLDDLKARADRISTLLTAFPHLFPPQTKPGVSADGSPSITTATLAIWQDFDAFYGITKGAATTAYDASQAATAGQFREQVKKLRGACDSCHAQFMRVEPPSPP
jgi:cytochrome c556